MLHCTSLGAGLLFVRDIPAA
ncbi:hypothetical protein SpCBS45565_g05218 [Spizellomyces sp. 'palustris']|nr:hypothetical protein SpCBS45565_g05218 [Spizellomyces sp. 'palustris']